MSKQFKVVVKSLGMLKSELLRQIADLQESAATLSDLPEEAEFRSDLAHVQACIENTVLSAIDRAVNRRLCFAELQEDRAERAKKAAAIESAAKW